MGYIDDDIIDAEFAELEAYEQWREFYTPYRTKRDYVDAIEDKIYGSDPNGLIENMDAFVAQFDIYGLANKLIEWDDDYQTWCEPHTADLWAIIDDYDMTDPKYWTRDDIDREEIFDRYNIDPTDENDPRALAAKATR